MTQVSDPVPRTPRHRFRLIVENTKGSELVALCMDKDELLNFNYQCEKLGYTFVSLMREDNPIRREPHAV